MLTENELLMLYDKVIKEAGKRIARQYHSVIGTHSGYFYKKTGQLERSFQNGYAVRNGNKILGYINDSDEVLPSPAASRWQFNHHMSWDKRAIWKDKYVPDEVPEWLDLGFTVVYRRRTWTYQGKHYIEDALEGYSDQEPNFPHIEKQPELNNKLSHILALKLGEEIGKYITRKRVRG